jgi:predicted AAA+ superfamily ATPase
LFPPRDAALPHFRRALSATLPPMDTSSPFAATATRWRGGRLEPVLFPQAVRLDELIGIDRQKETLVRNTAQFVRGAPANHALLTGARGTGKSSLVKALQSEFNASGLRLVEVHPHDLVQLPDIVAPLRDRRERFVLFVDDFSVASHDPSLVALKTALDGGIEEPPENVLVYATSNRRHLLPEHRSDNGEYHWEDGELHPGESTEEKISLSERFGLWLSFPPFSQDQYLELVRLHLQSLGQAQCDAATEASALRWALQRASRSGRGARQFAPDRVGRSR